VSQVKITRRVFLAVVLALGVAGIGCGSAASGTSAGPAASASASAYACVQRVLGRMSLAQRVGQLFLVGVPTPASGGLPVQVSGAIRVHGFGSVLFVGNSTAGVAGVRAVTGAVQSLAVDGVRLFVAANQEGGQIQPLSGPGFATIPSAVAQGEMSVAELRRDAIIWGRELAAVGVNLNLAPVLDVVPPGTAGQNAPIGMLERQFGGEPGPVADHGVAFIAGMRAAGVATTAKHFPGLGRVRGNTDFTANVVDTVTTATDPYLRTYRAAIEAGVPFVMVALATYTRIDPHHLAAFSSRVVTGLLRQGTHFQGVIVSDDLGAAAAVAALSPGERAIAFLSAGGDMITSASIQAAAEMAQAVLGKARSDAAFRDLVDAAALRILAAKQAAGLISCSERSRG
jgi:beta-N-acetylhexosaminidase